MDEVGKITSGLGSDAATPSTRILQPHLEGKPSKCGSSKEEPLCRQSNLKIFYTALKRLPQERLRRLQICIFMTEAALAVLQGLPKPPEIVRRHAEGLPSEIVSGSSVPKKIASIHFGMLSAKDMCRLSEVCMQSNFAIVLLALLAMEVTSVVCSNRFR